MITTPNLRFTSPLGAASLPLEERKFGDIVSWCRTNSLSRGKLTSDITEIQNIHYGDIHTKYPVHFVQEKSGAPYIDGQFPGKFETKDFCRVGDIVFADASEDLPDVGKAMEITSVTAVKIVSGLHTHMARPVPGVFAPGYAGYLMHSRHVRNQIERSAQGTKVYGISKKNLNDLNVVFPSIPEQEKIAAFLTAVTDKIDALTRKKTALEQYKAGLAQKLFSQEIRFTREDGSAYPDWVEMPFKELAKRRTKGINSAVTGSSIKVIELENIEGNSGRIFPVDKRADAASGKTLFEAGDVLFGKLRPYLRKYARPDFNGACSSEIWVLQGGVATSAFLYHLVQTDAFMSVANISSGSKMPRADWSVVSSATFCIPCRDEQDCIAEALTCIEKKIIGLGAQIESIQAFKHGLLQQMFV